MHVPSAYFNMVVYIYPNRDDAAANIIANGGGTGFLIGVASVDQEKPPMYVVTNAHIIEYLEGKQATTCTLRINTQDGKTETIDTLLSSWTKHPKGDDIAICSIEPNDNWQYNYITDEMLLKEEFIRTNIFEEQRTDEFIKFDEENNGTERKWKSVRKIGIGTDTIMVGRFMSHGGNLKNYPVVRRGHIAMLPFEPMRQTGRGHSQEGFLVETYSIGGFSGSPVFVQTKLNEHVSALNNTSSSTSHKEMVYLLGIDWGHFDFDGQIISIDGQNTIKIPSGMMCVVPSWKLTELLFNEDTIGTTKLGQPASKAKA